MTNSAQLRQILLATPITAIELAARLQITKRAAHSRLWVLSSQKQIECVGFGDRDPGVRWSKWPQRWGLTDHGRRLAARDLRKAG